MICSQMIPERNRLKQTTLINCQQLIIGRIRRTTPVPPSPAGDLHADNVHEVQDNQGFITYHISVTWSLSDKNDLTDICQIIFTQLLSDKIYHKKRLHKLFSESSPDCLCSRAESSRVGSPLETSKTFYKTYCRTYFVTLYLIHVV